MPIQDIITQKTLVLRREFFDEDLSASHCADNPEWFRAGGNQIGQRVVHRDMRKILAARKKAHKRAALQCRLVTNRPAQHRIRFFERIQNRANRNRRGDIDLHLTI